MEERFLQFSDRNANACEKITNMNIEMLEKHEILLEHCRSQGNNNNNNNNNACICIAPFPEMNQIKGDLQKYEIKKKDTTQKV